MPAQSAISRRRLPSQGPVHIAGVVRGDAGIQLPPEPADSPQLAYGIPEGPAAPPQDEQPDGPHPIQEFLHRVAAQICRNCQTVQSRISSTQIRPFLARPCSAVCPRPSPGWPGRCRAPERRGRHSTRPGNRPRPPQIATPARHKPSPAPAGKPKSPPCSAPAGNRTV